MKCVELDVGNAEGWNNLAAVYIKLDRQRDAFNCFRHGLKEKHGNWKMWENYMAVGIHVGDWNECVRAYDRLLYLKWPSSKSEHQLDLDALRAIILGVTSSDANDH